MPFLIYNQCEHNDCIVDITLFFISEFDCMTATCMWPF